MKRILVVVFVIVAACSRKKSDDNPAAGSSKPPPPAERVEAQVVGTASKESRIDRIHISANGLVALAVKPGAPATRIELATAKVSDVTLADVEDVALSPDGATLAVVKRDAVAIVKGSDAPVALKLPEDRSPTRAAFTPDGGLVVIAGEEHGFRLLAYDAKHALRSDAKAFYSSDGDDCTLALARDPDVALIENCHGTRVIRVHDGAVLAEVSPSGTSEAAGSAEIAPGQFATAFVVGEDNPAFELWQPGRLPGSRIKDVKPCALAPTGKLAACDHGDNEVIVFEPASQAVRLRVHVPDSVSTLRFTPDGSRLVMGMYDTRIAIADTSRVHASAPALAPAAAAFAIDAKQPLAREAPKRKLVPRVVELNDAPIDIVASPDNKRLVVSNATRGVLVVDLAKPTELIELFDTELGIHRPELAWSPDGSQLAVAESDPTERLVVRSATARDNTPREVTATIKENHVAWSANGLIATGGPSYGTVQVWKADGLAKTRVLEPPNKEWLGGVAFAADGRLVSWGDWAVTVVWNAETGEQVRQVGGHTMHAAWSRDGKLLVTQGRDMTLVVWDGVKLEPLTVVRDADVYTFAISPDGKQLAGSDLDGMTIWSLPDGKPVSRIEYKIARPKILAWPGPLVVGVEAGLALFTLR